MYKLTEENKNIREMFTAITGRYDFLNHLLSANIDKKWRRIAVSMMDLTDDAVLLDLATGTGDVAIEAMKQSKKALTVIGVDFTQAMLIKAIEKTTMKKAMTTFDFVNAPAESLPLKDTQFDYCTIAFGIRNVIDKNMALREMARVLKPGGQVVILEFSKPKSKLFNSVYSKYFLNILPVVGGLFSRKKAYQYLPESVARFPSNEEFADMMRAAGFKDVKIKPLTFGIASIYSARA
ncbi:bifunctional demethylmenaquinone methyltransferase/2-methoxy-6-polyprenyl-1,4-benzoquinol methylase UbiE [Thermodesulfobacteriota bacterium]